MKTATARNADKLAAADQLAAAALTFVLSREGRKAVADVCKAEKALDRVRSARSYVDGIFASHALVDDEGAPITVRAHAWLASDDAFARYAADVRNADVAHGFACARDGKCPELMAGMALSQAKSALASRMFGRDLYGDMLEEAVRLAKSVTVDRR